VDFTKMNILERLFVMLIIGAGGGDGRHWDAVKDWAEGLPAVLCGDGGQ
jgi:hypothetical protein